MATVKFYLKNPKENKKLRAKEVSIYAIFTRSKQERFTVTLDEKIQPKFWDFTNQQVKSTYRGHYEINEVLAEFKLKLLRLYRDNKTLPFEKFKALAQEKPSEKKTLFVALELFLSQYKTEKNSATLVKYNTIAARLQAFDSINPIDFPTLDYNFYDAFKRYLYAFPNPNYPGCTLVPDGSNDGCTYNVVATSEGEPIGLFDDIVHKYLVNLKVFLAWAKKRGYNVHPSYQEWEIIRRQHPPLSLTLSELERLENFDFSPANIAPHTKPHTDLAKLSKALDIARDYLVFECRTGQRISDIKRFNLKDFSDSKWTFTPRKGNRLSSKTVSVHFKGYCFPALGIIEKHNWKMPEVSEQKINDNIKTACKIVGIDTYTETFRWAQNKRVRISGPKYEFISSHIGRKTFITLSLQSGIPIEVVMELTGISDYKTVKHYRGKFEDSSIEEALNKIPTQLMRKAQ